MVQQMNKRNQYSPFNSSILTVQKQVRITDKTILLKIIHQ